MSLRDQLVAKGLATKKQARRARQQARKAKRKKGNRKQREAEAAAKARAEAEAERAARRAQAEADRAAHAAEREAHERRHRVRQIVQTRRMGGRGPIPFFVAQPGTGRIHRLMLREDTARDLRSGRAAIAAWRAEDDTEVPAVVPAETAERLQGIDAGSVWHHVHGTDHLGRPEEALARPPETVSLRPHRVGIPAEAAAWRARQAAADADPS